MCDNDGINDSVGYYKRPKAKQPPPDARGQKLSDLYREIALFLDACFDQARAGNRTGVKILRAVCRHLTDRCGAELTPPEMIGQEELAAFCRFGEKPRKSSEREWQQWHDSIRERLLAGVPVQPGPLKPAGDEQNLFIKGWEDEAPASVQLPPAPLDSAKFGCLCKPENGWMRFHLESSFKDGKYSGWCLAALIEDVTNGAFAEHTARNTEFPSRGEVWAYLRARFKGSIKHGLFYSRGKGLR